MTIRKITSSGGIKATTMDDRVTITVDQIVMLQKMLPAIQNAKYGVKIGVVANDSSDSSVLVQLWEGTVSGSGLGTGGGTLYSALSLREYHYKQNQIVFVLWDTENSRYVIIDDYGETGGAKDLNADADAADTTAWNAKTEATAFGADCKVHRVKFVTGDNKIYDYNRTYTISNVARTVDVTAETRTQLLPNGFIDSPVDIGTATTDAADATDWDGQADKTAIAETYISRVKLSLDDMKLYGYYRIRTYDSLGCLRSVSGETRVTVAELSTDCVSGT